MTGSGRAGPDRITRVKGVAMKRIVVVLCAALGLCLSAGRSEASWGHLSYSGYQPWWNVFAKRYKCLTPEEERLQKFWHDYYDALKCFYCALDHIDWVAYYKNHGYQINCGAGGGPGACCGRINYAPVFVSPTLQWAVPSSCMTGPPATAPYGPGGPPMGSPYAYGPGGGGYAGPGGGGYGGPGGPMYAGGPGYMGGPGGPGGYAGGPGGYPGGMPGGMPGNGGQPPAGMPTSTQGMPGAN
jgi:hypothetical protein